MTESLTQAPLPNPKSPTPALPEGREESKTGASHAVTRSAVIRTLRVDRMPGFPVRGFSLADLSPGINILHGPNGVGKSTAGRAAHALFWPPSDLKTARVAGEVLIDARPHTLTLEDGYSRDADGRSPDDLGAPPADARDRYRLAFHDLIAGDNAGFAEYILRESVGGYDIAAAGRQLGFKAEIQRPDKKRAAVRAAQETYRAALGQQQALDQKAFETRGLEEQLHSLRALIREREHQAGTARRIESYRTLRGDERAAAVALRAFPGPLRRYTGTEQETLAALDRRAEQQRHALRRWIAERRDSNRERRAVGLPDSVSGSADIGILQMRMDALEDALQKQDELRRLLTQADAREREARRRRDPDLEFGQIDAMGAAAVGEMAQYLRRLSAHGGREAAQSTLDSWLGATTPPENLDALRAGTECLSAWLSAAGPAPKQSSLPAACAVFGATALLCVAALAFAGQRLAWIAVFPLLIALWLATRKPAVTDEARLYQERFQQSGLPSVATWEREAVTTRLRELRTELAAAERALSAADFSRTFEHQRQDVAREGEELARERERLRGKFGLILDPERGGDAALLHAIEALQHWQGVAEDLAAARAAADAQEIVCASRLRAVNDALRDVNMDPVDTLEEARTSCHQLESAIQRHASARDAAQRARAMAAQEIAALRAIGRERAGLLRSRGADSAETCLRFCSRHAAYTQARSAWRALRVQRLQMKRALLQDADVTPARLKAAPDIETGAEIEEAKARAQRLSEEITEIRTRVSEVKKRHDVEVAYSALTAAMDDLAAARDAECEAVAGYALLEFLGEQSRDQGRPRVFRRASELLQRITGGRYTLEFRDASPPSFRAHDTLMGEVRTLDELSSGTRVQLLVAVRLAFLEDLESGVKFPLIVDEVLANSDDARAAAIMDALFHLSRDGRQIFYLTAQTDEVEKWKAKLERAGDIPYRIVEMEAGLGSTTFG